MNLGINLWYVLLAIIAGALVIFALGWHSSTGWHDKQAARRQLEADQRTAAERGLLDQRAPMPTYRGWLYDTSWRPADPGPDTVPMSMVDALDMADAAYQLGARRATDDQTHDEVEAMWAEVEANPKQWQQ